MPPLLDSALDLTQWGMVGRVALAMVLGAVVGYERQLASKPAGLRTHMLVAGAGALLVSLGQSVIDAFPDDAPQMVVAMGTTALTLVVLRVVAPLEPSPSGTPTASGGGAR